jgi:mycothiol S-conjugate amidase
MDIPVISGENLRLMAVHAHPDDESSKGAAAMAKYVAEGVDVLVVTCTGGERGSVLNKALDRPEIWENIAEIRRAEMDKAREILGVSQHWLGFVDSGLPEGDPLPPLPEGCFGLADLDEAVAALVAEVRAFRPHVMTTYDENGGYPHPDHIMCHKISVAAFDAAGDPDQYPELGEVWQPLKLYYNVGFNKTRVTAMHEGMLAAGMESPYAEWLEKWEDREDKGDRTTTRVPCGEFFQARDDALRAHATQVDPEGFWFKVPLSIQQQIWPTDDFQLVRSFVDPDAVEDDLFAGVRASVSA